MRTVFTAAGYTEGPVHLSGDRVAFTSMSEGQVLVVENGDLVQRIVTGGGPTGIAVDEARDLYVVQNNGLWGAPTSPTALLCRISGSSVEPVRDLPLVAPNDLCFGPDGRLYITDPISSAGLEEPVPGRVFALDLDSGELELLCDSLLFPNGIAFDARGRLFVAESFKARIVRLDPVRAGEWSVHPFASTVDGQPDGLAFDADGCLWAAVNSSDSLQVFAPDGSAVRRVGTGTGRYPSNLCFGEPGTLYVTTAGTQSLTALDPGVEGLALHDGSTVRADQ